MKGAGITVLRFSDREVLMNLDEVLKETLSFSLPLFVINDPLDLFHELLYVFELPVY